MIVCKKYNVMKLQKFFSFIKDNITILTLMFYSIGIIHEVVFYELYGINIFDYINFSDFLLFPIQNLVRLSLYFIPLYILFNITITDEYKILTYYLGLSFCCSKIVIIIYMIMHYCSGRTAITMISLILIIVFVWLVLPNLSEKLKKLFFPNLLIIIFLIITIFSAFEDYKNAFIDNHNKIEFFYKEKQYKTEKNLVLIGMTQNYIFLYDKTNDNKIIIKRDEIEDLQILNKGMFK